MKEVKVPNDILLGTYSALMKEGTAVRLRANGYSMLPFVRHAKDDLEMEYRTNVEVGDIVLAHLTQENRYVAHRVIKIDGDILTLKGDGNLDRRETCTRDEVCGTVTKIITPSERVIDCQRRGFRFLSYIWRHLPRPLRRVMLHYYRKLFP